MKEKDGKMTWTNTTKTGQQKIVTFGGQEGRPTSKKGPRKAELNRGTLKKVTRNRIHEIL